MTSSGTMPEEYYFLGYAIARITPELGKWNSLGHRHLTDFVKHCIRNVPSLKVHYFGNTELDDEKTIDKRAYSSLKGLRDEFWNCGVPKPDGYSETDWGNEPAPYHIKQIENWNSKSIEEITHAVMDLYSTQTITDANIDLLPTGLPPNGETLFRRSRSQSGWIYVVTNPKWKNWVKVGVTRNLKKRLSSYNTSSPNRDFRIEWHKYHDKSTELESIIHDLPTLNPFRGHSKEWYNLSAKDCIPIIERAFKTF